MSPSRRVRLAAVLVVVLVLGGFVFRTPDAWQAKGDSFVGAWDQARAAGSYRFSADIQQTLLPRARPDMVGQSEQRVNVVAQGEVQLPDQSRLQLQISQGLSSVPPLTLIQRGDQTFMQKGDTLELVQNPVGALAPSVDFMGYLAAAENIRPLEPAPLPGSASSALLTHYAFDVSGARFADYLRAELAARVQREVGTTVTIAVPDSLSRLGGVGELWVDAEGFPQRQVLDLVIPQTTDAYDARARLVIDFRDFGQVTALPQPVRGGDGQWRVAGGGQAAAANGAAPAADQTPPALIALAPSTLILFGLTALIAIVIVARRRRALYALVVGVTVTSMLVSPLLQALRVIDFSERRAEAASAQPLTDALGLTENGRPLDSSVPGMPSASPIAAQTATTTAQRILACGDGADGVDSDNDGLSDRVESCLGTDAYNDDTDGDGLKDGVEVTGFSYGGKTWFSDPLKVDSNADGRSDLEEWPRSAGGQSAVIDTDNDGVPDLWDMDDDGDGVDDNLDLSPTSATGFAGSFNLQTQNPSFDGAQYIEIQLQPQRPGAGQQDHLRFGSATFNWPSDDKGTIADLDDSTKDLQLIPVLQVDTTVVPPSDLAQKYGVTVLREGSVTRLIVPLAAVSANTTTGGDRTIYDRVQAFYAKVGYGPNQQADIRWTKMKLVWMVQATLDSYVRCADPDTPSSTTCQVASTTSAIQTYEDSFRLSGLRVTKSRAFESAIFGTPQFPLEDQQLFNFNLALSGLFMSTATLPNQAPGETFLQEVQQRFTSPNTPSSLRWGVADTTTVAVSRTVYTHHDEGIAGVSAAAQSFLAANYPDSVYGAARCSDSSANQFKCAMLALAVEEQTAVTGLEDLSSLDPAGLVVNIGETPLTTVRSWRMMGYEEASGQWQAMSPERTIDVMNQRYSGAALQALLTEARQTYPLLTLADMRFLTYIAYASATTGASRPVQVGALNLLLDEQVEDRIIGIVRLQAARTPTYFGGVLGASQYLQDLRNSYKALNSLREPDELPLVQAEQAAYLRSQTYWARTGQVAAVAGGVLLAGALILQAVQQACLDRNAPPGTEPRDTCNLDREAIKIASITIGAAQQAVAVVTLIVTIKGFTQASAQTGAQAGSLLASFKAAGNVAKGMAILGLVIQLAVIWTSFGLVAAKTTPGSIAFNMALASAIVATIIAVIFFALAFVPGVNIVVAIIGIIDGIVSLATNGRFSLTAFLIEGILKVFYDIDLLANITGTESLGSTSGLTTPGQGVVPGNSFEYRDTFSTSFSGSRVSSSDANAWMELRGQVPSGGASVNPSPVNQSAFTCIRGEDQTYTVPGLGFTATIGTSTCTNDAGVSFRFTDPRPNVELKVEALLHYTLPYQECGIGICGSVKHERGESDPTSFSLFLDVLPANLDGFLAFRPMTNNPAHKFNPDTDGDGLPDSLEAQIGTDATKWDTDGDGLSDGYEFYSRATLGTDPLKADTDGDGLSDALELRLGTKVADRDSDADGLLDGEEVCHVQNGALVGGWDARVFGATRPTVRVCSHPLERDADGDGMSDRMERDNTLSPFAANEGPRLSLYGRPIVTGPDGQRGVYVKPGDRITPTLELASFGAYPVTRTLQICLPGALTGITGGALTGIANPPTRTGPTAGCGGAGSTGFAWPFDTTKKLDLTQVVSATFQTQAVNTTTSTTGTVQTSLVYGSQTLTNRIPVVVDADNPTVQITSPANGAVLRGTSFVVGGTAADPTSWVTAVSVAVGNGGAQPATGAAAWAWTWSAPADGAYTLNARATDYLGNVGSGSVNVTVDNTPPTATINPPGGVSFNGTVYVRPGAGTNIVALGGGAGDNLSGVGQVQISLDRQPWREVTFNGTTWSFDWELSGDAQGSHLVQVRSFDVAGNESAPVTQTVIVDAAPPTDDLTSPDLSGVDTTGVALDVKAGTAFTVYGRANDAGRVPLPSRPVALSGSVDALNQATVWLQPPSPRDYDGGINPLWLGDTNGDGRGDLAVGLPAANPSSTPSQPAAGGVYVVYGRGGGWPILPDAEGLANAPLMFVGAPGAAIGGIVASAGDVDGDGRYDLLIGDATNGRVFLVFGRATRLSRTIPLNGPRSGDWQVLTLPTGATLRQVAAAGDVNGDGFGDFLIRTSDRVYLLLGHTGVWDPTLAVTTEAAAQVVVGAAALASGVGDADGVQSGGKSFGDFVITDPANTLGGGSAVYLFTGGVGFNRGDGRTLNPATDAVKFTGAGTVGDKLAALGNVTGDVFADFIFSTGGGPKLVYKDSGGAWQSLVFSGYTPAATGLLAGVGDVNRDGKNDILIGAAGGDAYLFAGAASLAAGVTPEAVLTGVGAAASAPYAAGADLNCDASSDLLLIPGAALVTAKRSGETGVALPRTELSFATAHVAPDALPQAPSDGGRQPADGGEKMAGAASGADKTAGVQTNNPATLYVDDDYCSACANDGRTWGSDAYATIQSAVDAADAGDTIVVRPGGYSSFSVVGAAKNGLTIAGVNADAVFVDGAGALNAVLVQNVDGVTLRNLTIRNAQRGVRLENAGRDGWRDGQAAKQTVFDRLLIHSMTTNTVSMDRLSTLNTVQSTLAGNASAPFIAVDATVDTALLPVWDATPTPAPLPAGGARGGSLAGTSNYVFSLPGNGSTRLDRYNPTSNSWAAQLSAPLSITGTLSNAATGSDGNLYLFPGKTWLPVGGGVNAKVTAIQTAGSDLIVAGDFTQATNPDGTTVPANRIARWNGRTWSALGGGVTACGDPCVRSIQVVGADIYIGGSLTQVTNTGGGTVAVDKAAKWNGSAWSSVGSGLPANAAVWDLAHDGTTLYAAAWPTDNNPLPYAVYRTDGTGWSPLGNLVGAGANQIEFVGGMLYATRFSDMYRWNGSTWEALVLFTQTFGGQGSAYTLATDGSVLYVGGLFDRVDQYLYPFPTIATNLRGLARYDPANGGSWSSVGPYTSYPVELGGFTPLKLAVGANTLYAMGSVLWRYANGSWSQVGVNGEYAAPYSGGVGSNLVVDAAGYVYLGDAGGLTATNNNLAVAGPGMIRYDVAGNTWSRGRSQGLDIYQGMALTGADNGTLYALSMRRDANDFASSRLYRYTIAGDTLDVRASPPFTATLGTGLSMAAANGSVYVLRGNALNAATPLAVTKAKEFYRYDATANTWTAAPSAPMPIGAGAGLVWDGQNYLYATQGGSGNRFARYRLADDTWEELTTTSFQVDLGGGLARSGNTLYVTEGVGFTPLHRYGPVGINPVKLNLDRVALIAPQNAAAATWLTPAIVNDLPIDFKLGRTAGAWVGESGIAWSPTLGSGDASLTLAQAQLVDQAGQVYRLKPNSTLAAGYVPARGDAYVAAGYCATCANDGLTWGQTAFSSIQAAIDSGATRVNLRPGLYREPFYLVTGVQVNGSGPDLTIVQPPAGASPPYLVSAEGVVGAGLNRLTLAGAGLRVENGAQSVRLSRTVIRDATTAIRQDGAATELEVVNNTLVRNASGLVATSCAAVDVRNTVFASHTGVALQYQGAGSPCAPTPIHLERYNLFWLNTGDVQVDGGAPQAASGLGDITLDPAFTSLSQNNFRPRAGSPTADAGNPTDPAPPGSGSRVDIGAFEVGQAAFYADDNYCDPAINSACVNDGLTWQVDAFSRIQDAVNAASIAAQAVNTPTRATTFTVGVGPGTYNERVTLPSYIKLVGSGAERTVINGGGVGDVVTINGAVQAEVRGFTITGSGAGASNAGIRVAGASNTVNVTRTIIRGNRLGILFTGGATGEASFNTVVNNTGAGLRSEGANTWVTVSNNILSGNGVGLDLAAPAQLFHLYNLLYNTPNADFNGGLTADGSEIVGQNPTLTMPDYQLDDASPAIDSAQPGITPPVGGGMRADLGYRERLAVPLTLLFGREGVSCAVGASGMGTVDVALVSVPIANWSSPVTSTVPSDAAWTPATFQGGAVGDTARYWQASVTPPSEGLYRLYTRAADRLGNQEPPAPAFVSDLYAGAFFADATAPTVTWVTPSANPATTAQAAIELVAQASDYINNGPGPRFSVASVSFEVDGVVWPATWSDATVPTSGPRAFRAIVPLTVGPHTVKAVALDRAGNRGESSLSITSTASGDTATITSIQNGDTTNQPTLTVTGHAVFATAGPNHQVAVTLNSQPAGQAALANPTAQSSAWSILVNLPNPNTSANHTISVAASSSAVVAKSERVAWADADTAKPAAEAAPALAPAAVAATADLGSTVTFRLDRQNPTVNVTSPSSSGPFSGPVILSGTAADGGGGGPDHVEVSVDGGLTWLSTGVSLFPGSPTNGSWSLTWTPPANQDGLTFPVLVRAVDKGGNRTTPPTSLNLKIDNVAPQPVTPTFNPIVGTHLGAPGPLQITWAAPPDGSGPPDVLVAVDKTLDTEPSQVVTSPQTANLNSGGQWYAHVTARDAAGNRTTTHFGPWYVDSADSGLCIDTRTIQVDGVINLATSEWRDDRDLLDDDERPATRQKFYATWDTSALYLGWHGAVWDTDGALWAYASTGAAGTTTPVEPVGGLTLPFAANLAVKIDSPTTGTLYTSGGGAWTAQSGLTFAAAGADTEIRVPWSLSNGAAVRLLAYAVTDSGSVWSVFPTTNPLAGPWTSSYQWANACAVTVPQSDQPVTKSARLTLTSPQSSLIPQGPSGAVQYTVDVQNLEASTLLGLQLVLIATSGLTYQTVDGGNVTPTGSLTVPLAPLGPGASRQVVVGAQLAPNLSTLQAVTTTAQLQLPTLTSAPLLAQASLTHPVDGQPPTVQVSEQVLNIGANTLNGSASDGVGIGVKRVEFRRLGAATWSTATGTVVWTAPLVTTVGDGTSVTVEFRAIDLYDQVGPVQQAVFVLDSVPPTVNFSLPSRLGGAKADIVGATSDPFPTGGQVVKVEVQTGDASAPWQEAVGPFAASGGAQGWTFSWNLPNVNGQTLAMRARATDAAGNVGISDFQSTVVDTTAADLRLSLQRGSTPPVPGTAISYVVTVDNLSANDVVGATVSDSVPSGLTNVTWTCTATAFSSCGGDSGTGGLNSAGTSLVAAGGRLVYTVNALIAPTARNTLTYGASVTLPTSIPDYAPSNNSATDSVLLTPISDLAVVKTDAPDPVFAGSSTAQYGQALVYTLQVTNSGPSAANQVQLTDALPQEVTFVSVTASQGVPTAAAACTAPAVGSKGSVICNLGTLAPQGSATVTITTNVDPQIRGTISNTATVTSLETGIQPDRNLTNNTSTQTTTVLGRADLAVSQTAAPNPVSVGQELAYSIRVVNNGPSEARGVTLSDAVPERVQFVSATYTNGATQGTCSGSIAAVCQLGVLAVGGNATVTLKVKPTTPGTILTNVARVLHSEADPNATNNESSLDVSVSQRGGPPSADLSLTMSASPTTVNVGQDLVYTLAVKNLGSSDASGVIVQDTLPTGVTFTSATFVVGAGAPQSCSQASGVVTCNVGTMAMTATGSTATVTIAVKAPTSAGTITNRATVSGKEVDPNTGNNTASLDTTVGSPPTADIGVSISDSPDPAVINGNLTYAIVVRNSGPSSASAVTLSDPLPSGVAFSSVSTSAGSCTGPAVGSAGTVNCSLGSMAVGATITVTLVVRAPSKTGTLSNTVTVSSSVLDPNTANNSATAVTTINRR